MQLISRLPLTLAAVLAISCDANASETASPASVTAQAAPPAGSDTHPHRFHRGRHRLDALCDRLACSDQQRSRLEAAFREHARPDDKEREQQKQARDNAKKKLARAFASGSFSEKDLQAFRATMDTLRARREQDHQQLVVKVHQILTPEQRKQLASDMEKRGPRFMGPRRGKGGARGHRGPHGSR